MARISLDGIDSIYPYALMIPQNETERVLEEHLAKRGVTVERNVALDSFIDQGDAGRRPCCARPAAKPKHSTADWLIGCDGAHSTVRHGLGFTFDGTTQPSDWLLADGHITGLDAEDRPAHLLAQGRHPGHLPDHRGTLPHHRRPRRGRGQQPPRRPDPGRGPGAADAARLPEASSSRTPYWLAAFRINERKVSHYRHGRVLLAGDAAHIHSPAGGQGMNTGMQDAFNLAWKLGL